MLYLLSLVYPDSDKSFQTEFSALQLSPTTLPLFRIISEQSPYTHLNLKLS